MKKVLIIAHDFPPIGGGGVMRTTKFVKYLPHFGWQPTVLTVKQSSALSDHDLADDIPKNIDIVRTRSLSAVTFEHKIRGSLGETQKTVHSDLGMKGKAFKVLQRGNLFLERFFFIPDKRVLWNRNAYRAAKKIIENSRIDLIYTTGPPHSTHLIGLMLRKRYDLPWVADFRDGWTSGPEWQPMTRLHEIYENSLERKVVKSCQKLITATGPIGDYISNKYGPDGITTITNGYDPDDFSGKNDRSKNPGFTIIYAGSLKRKRSGYDFYKALSELIRTKAIEKKDLNVEFYGRIVPTELDLMKKYQVDDVISCKGYIPHKQMCQKMKNADVLLIITYKNERFSEAVFTGKIFDYIAAQRTILAIVTPGVAKDLIIRESLGSVAEPDNLNDIKEKILDLYRRWQMNRLSVDPKPDLLHKYSRIELTKKLAEIFNGLVN